MPAVAIAVPVYADDSNSQVAGYWVAIVNLADIESNLMQLGHGGSRILLVDHNGTEIADTGRVLQDKTDLKSFAHLKSVQDALSGQTGSEVEEMDGLKMTASFAPIQAHPHLGHSISRAIRKYCQEQFFTRCPLHIAVHTNGYHHQYQTIRYDHY